MNKKLLFSITKKDFKITNFRASGKGGQRRNKVETAVRILHKDSGAIGICTKHRVRIQNQKEAFRRLINSEKFKIWHKIEIAKHLGTYKQAENKAHKLTEEQMKPENIKIEYF